MEELKRLIIQLVTINNTIPFDKWKFFKTKRDINRIIYPLESPILRLEGFCGLFNPSRTCYLNASLQLLFRIDTFIDFLHNFESPEEINLLDYNLSDQLYKTQLDRIQVLLSEQKELTKQIGNILKTDFNTNISSIYDDYSQKINEINTIRDSIDIFDKG
jgi:ubiquitin C-terminal hydrolase